MRENVTIVTAFFNIGRENYKRKFCRTSNQYMEHFRFWARIKNQVVIYTTSEYSDEIERIRNEYGRGDETTIIVVDDITTISKDIFMQLSNALSNSLTVAFRTNPDSPESFDPYYNYIMCLKPMLVSKTIKDGLASGMVAWMDFGYNHGGEYFGDPMDFDFLYDVQLPYKISIFNFSDDLYSLPIFEVVRTMKSYMAGGFIIAPAELWHDLLRLYKQAIKSLTDCGLADDDQTVLLMAYREKPELFNCIPITEWMEPFKITANREFKLVQQKRKLYKETKKMAKKLWKSHNYKDAAKFYCKYIYLKFKIY